MRSVARSDAAAIRTPLRAPLGVARSRKSGAAAFAVGGYIGAAYWFTSSTSFANPAVTLARALTDTFAGIEPSAVPAFVIAQFVGGAAAVALGVFLYPGLRTTAQDVVVPSDLTSVPA